MKPDIGLFIDPGTVSVGWCVAGAGPEVRSAGRCVPESKDYVVRTDAICDSLSAVVFAWSPTFIQVERLSGAHSAIAKYGYAVGAIRGYLRGKFS